MKQNISKPFGPYLKHIREERKLSIRELASRAGIDSGGLTRLEHGKISNPAPDTLKALAAALGVPLADMFAWADYVIPDELPSMDAYLHARYGHLPEAELAAISDYLQRLTDEYGLDRNGPLNYENEPVER